MLLAAILNKCVTTGRYSSSLKQARTSILKKLSKPDYTSATAYLPIGPLICLSKVLEAALVNRMQNYAETHHLLPDGYCGGKAKRSTSDTLTNLTIWTKNQWARFKVVGTLFVDVKAAFPTVDPQRMTDTLEKMGYCPSINRLIATFLSHRKTTFQLGDFRSEPKQLTIGLPQGSPLSVILYILYNASLLCQAEGTDSTIAIGFIDDVAFLTARYTHEDTLSSLQTLASRELEWGKKHGAAFDKKKSQWMLLSHRKPPPEPLTLSLGEVTLKPQPSVKWLGVTVDLKLTFSLHIKNQAATGLKAANRLASLARTGWGVPLDLCKRLTSSLIFSRTDYACVVWFRPTASTSATAALQRVANVAHRFTLGVFKTHPTDFLLHDSNSLSTKCRLACKSNAAVARLLTLPLSNPAGSLTLQALSQHRARHKSSIHHLLHAPSGMWSHVPSTVEVIDPHKAPPAIPAGVTSSIAETRAESHDFVSSNLSQTPPTHSWCFATGQAMQTARGQQPCRMTVAPSSYVWEARITSPRMTGS